MSNINVSNKKTFVRKLGTFAGLGLAGIITYYGITKIDQNNKNSEFEERVSNVLELVEEQKFGPAQELFSDYENEKLLRPEDKIKIKTEIKTKKSEYEKKQANQNWKWKKNAKEAAFESKLETSLQEAEAELEDLKKSRMFSTEEINKFKDKIYSHTEDGLKQTWQKGENIKKVCEEYLQNYPEGIYKKEAVKNLLRTEISSLVNDFENKGNLVYTKIKLDNLNKHLKEYADEGIDLSEATDKEEIFYKAISYILETYKKDNNSWLFVGDKVKFSRSSWDDNFIDDTGYKDERNSIIPVGSEGVLIGYSDRKENIVEFESVKKTWWKHSWKLDKYWTKSRRNVAKFHNDELTKIPPMNKYFKDELIKQSYELRTNLQTYISK